MVCVGNCCPPSLSDEVRGRLCCYPAHQVTHPSPYLGCVCVLEAGSWRVTQADLLLEAINLPASAWGGEYHHARFRLLVLLNRKEQEFEASLCWLLYIDTTGSSTQAHAT